MRRALRRLRRDEGGFTLVELLVVSLLLAVVLGVIAGIYLSTARTQSSVSEVSNASTGAQSAATSIDRAVRTATEVHQLGAGGSLIVARIPGSTGDEPEFRCNAWYYEVATPGRIWFKSFADGTTVSEPTTAQLDSWTLLLEGVRSRGSSGTIFGLAQGALTVAFDATAGDHPSVKIDMTTRPLTSPEMETALCS